MKLTKKVIVMKIIAIAVLASVYNVSEASIFSTTPSTSGTSINGSNSNTPAGANSLNGSGATGLSNNSGGSVASQGISTTIEVPNYDDATLANAGCDKQVWNQMLADYQNKAQTIIQSSYKMQVANQMQGAPTAAAVGQCFDSAAQIINNATRVYNTISGLLTGGGMDSSLLYAYAQKVVVGYACSQINSYIAKSGLATTISSGVNTVGGYTNMATNTNLNVGGANLGTASQAMNSSGYKTNTASSVPYTTGAGIANSTGTTSTVSSTFSSINPFK